MSTPDAAVRRAAPHDSDILVELMAQFYAESGFPVDRGRAVAAFAELLSDDRLGRVWLLRVDAQDVGYVVMTLGYSMEYGGRDAFVDDLFVQAAHRGRGLGTMALSVVKEACAELGVRAIHLEVGHDNTRAYALYRGIGFEDNNRHLLTLRLAEPMHEV